METTPFELEYSLSAQAVGSVAADLAQHASQEAPLHQVPYQAVHSNYRWCKRVLSGGTTNVGSHGQTASIVGLRSKQTLSQTITISGVLPRVVFP